MKTCPSNPLSSAKGTRTPRPGTITSGRGRSLPRGKKAANSLRKRIEEERARAFIEWVRQKTGLDAVAELQFHPTRKWRFDYAVPSHMIALEVEGGSWNQGRHTRALGFRADIEKYNTATMMGWRLLRTVPEKLYTLDTLRMLKRMAGQVESEKSAKKVCP